LPRLVRGYAGGNLRGPGGEVTSLTLGKISINEAEKASRLEPDKQSDITEWGDV
jgi:hypothetical protein